MQVRALHLHRANAGCASLSKSEHSAQILCRVEHQKASKTTLHAAPAFV
jgi:hypothetical protein